MVANETRRRGGPLAMLALLIAVWVMGRAVLWESPFPLRALEVPSVEELFAENDDAALGFIASAGDPVVEERSFSEPLPARLAAFVQTEIPVGYSGQPQIIAGPSSDYSMVAAGHQFLMAAAFRVDWDSSGAPAPQSRRPSIGRAVSPIAPVFADIAPELDRWSLDAFAFYRAGSNSRSVSQGRVPVYGASQAGANLQYRFAPTSVHDPRAYVRAYRALVANGESEAAVGVSARPIGVVPVRIAAEMRVTDSGFGTQVRPAAYAVTELPPVDLPLGTKLEAYGGAGYVGGTADTLFADGQLAVTRKFVQFEGVSARPVRLSLGAAAWGGAQEDASRLDVGPTMRVDLTIGEVPARISVDWRERVAGDAAPNSGIAATISTRF